LLTPAQRRLRAQIAAHHLHARVNGTEHTAPARNAFMARFELEADPDGILDPAERKRRAEHLRKAYFKTLAFKSAKARARGGDAA
jgi:hypothetical protein